MSTDFSQWPLLVLMDDVDRWVLSVKGRYFWEHCAEHRWWAEKLRDEAKGIIIWLELKGHDEAAERLAEEMDQWRQTIMEFWDPYHPVEETSRDSEEARESLIAAAGRVCGAAEDLQDEVPEEAWEGFFDV